MEKKPKTNKKEKEKEIGIEDLNKYTVHSNEVDYKTRTVLILDSRNDLVPFFFGGLDAMAANYESKAVNHFVDFVWKTCQGFIETVREKSLKIMESENPDFGITDIVKNNKNQYRFIVNMFLDPRTKELNYSWVDPKDSKTPMSACSQKTMRKWMEKN